MIETSARRRQSGRSRGAAGRRRCRLTARLCLALMCGCVLFPAASRASDDVSTGKRVLGVTLGSVNGALAARALTINHARTPTIALVYAGAVGGGAAIGYAVAGNDDALVAMGILLIPLAVLNIVLPSSSYDAVATAGETVAGPGATGDWWESALWRAVPLPAASGMRLAPVQVRF